MLPMFLKLPESNTLPLTAIAKHSFNTWRINQSPTLRAWVDAVGFKAGLGSLCPVPDKDARLQRILVGLGDYPDDFWLFGGLPFALPSGSYRLDPLPEEMIPDQIALGWALGTYGFERYKTLSQRPARLVWPEGCNETVISRTVKATILVRDLINTPANEMGPQELEAAAKQLAAEYSAKVLVIAGEELIKHNYPLIHIVGTASPKVPRLIDLQWGSVDAPRLSIVGKGVCFDSGGLNLKAANSMFLMKKDMAGAAHALGLAQMIMEAELPVRLRVLIPAVENAVSGLAMRPMDVVTSRRGLSVEVGNTDAEGRLVLADALTEACAEKPALLVDFATLTGAARVALGTDISAVFCNHEPTWLTLEKVAKAAHDPLWRLPLWAGYAQQLQSRVADLSSTGDGVFGGAILAALFLEQFVDRDTPWVHIDLYGWNPIDRPGRPKGGEAMTLRAVYALVEERFKNQEENL
jgi:leucyl aminopeptidase